jgi:hypothetical protein
MLDVRAVDSVKTIARRSHPNVVLMIAEEVQHLQSLAVERLRKKWF